MKCINTILLGIIAFFCMFFGIREILNNNLLNHQCIIAEECKNIDSNMVENMSIFPTIDSTTNSQKESPVENLKQENIENPPLFSIKEGGYIFLGTVIEKNDQKIWSSIQVGNPNLIGDIFENTYPLNEFFLEAGCLIYKSKVIKNGRIVAHDTFYMVLGGDIELEKRGDQYEAWLFIETYDQNKIDEHNIQEIIKRTSFM